MNYLRFLSISEAILNNRIYRFLLTNLNNKTLNTALTKDAIITAKIAKSCVAGSEKARFAINIATVNPIPAALPVANMSTLLAPCGY